MWRPDKWDNPFHKTADYGHGKQSWNEEPEFTAFEAGADAMLEALKKKKDTVRLKFDGTSRIPAHGDYPEIIIEGKPYDKGWMVYVPEED